MTTTGAGTTIEAVVSFSAQAAVDPTPYELSLFGPAGERGDSSLLAHADTEQTLTGPFAPFPCRVRLFGRGGSR